MGKCKFIGKIKDKLAAVGAKIAAFMAVGKRLIITQVTMCVVSFFLNIWGLLSLTYVIGIFDIPKAFGYFDSVPLIAKYVLIIVNMAVGILLFSAFAGSLKGKQKNIWLLINTTYSTILTLPLLYTFLALFAAPGGARPPMVDLIYDGVGGFGGIQPVGVQYFVFVLGTIMSLVFIAVPILSCIDGLKKNNKKMALEALEKNANEGVNEESNNLAPIATVKETIEIAQENVVSEKSEKSEKSSVKNTTKSTVKKSTTKSVENDESGTAKK